MAAVVLGLSTSVLTSCHLDEAPTTYVEVKDGDHAITSDLEMKVMRNGIYSSFRSTFYGDRSQTEEVMCDGFNATSDFGNQYGPAHRMDASFTASDYAAAALWDSCYVHIKDYNIFINSAANYAEANPDSKNTADYDMAEAYFFRAYTYLQLVRHYAKAYDATSASSDLGVPIVLKYDLTEKPERATVAKVYEQIKSDLDNASTLGLASTPGAIASEVVTSDALNMMYARYFLDIKNYNEAANYALKVINSAAGYAISSTPAEMKAEYSNDEGTEAIMQLPASATENGSGTNDIYTNSDYYSALAQYPGKGVYQQPYYIPSQKLLNQYGENDLRLAQWFQNKSYPVYLAGGFDFDVYTFVKYLGNPDLNTDGIPNGRQHVKPFMISEAYLIYAEASYEAGNVTEAKEMLNKLQERRGATLTEATAATIQNEWFRETVGEGLRMSCLKRWGIGYEGREAQPYAVECGYVQTGKSYAEKSMPADDIHWVWPIPSYEIRVNNNLKQNPGY